MNWTKEQEQAINERGKNIIVSAAAGSGKTAVLVERIRKIVVEEKTPIDKLLVVTFTNAAASEMKEKIRKSLMDELERNPEEATFIRLQLDKLQTSYISTFHSFAIKSIRRFFYLADVTANFKICGEDKSRIFREDALDFVIEKYLREGSEEAIMFFDSYSSDRNFNKIRDMISEIYKKVMAHPLGIDLLRNYVKEMESKGGHLLPQTCEETFKSMVEELIWEALECAKKMVEILELENLDRFADFIKSGELYPLEEMAKIDFDDESYYAKVYQGLENFKPEILRARKEEKDSYAKIRNVFDMFRTREKTIVKTLKDEFFVNDFATEADQIDKTLPLAEVLCNMLEDFTGYYNECKAEENLLDFNDLEHVCLKILENESAREYYREKFDYVLVDEFQDTNLLQNEILERISREDNLFIVGDVKQSIYKFRLAEPEIFQGIYSDYKCGAKKESIAIDLNKNYRSKEPIVEAVNKVFYEIMEGYDDNAALHCGIPYDGPYKGKVQFDVLVKDEEEKTTGEDGEEEIVELAAAEREAHYVANLILENYGKTIWDGKKQVERPLKFSDMVILMRAKGKMETFYSILKSRGIEASVEDIGGYFDTLEIDIFINLLSIIDNKKQDIPLISVLHSEMFGFTSSELAEIRASKKSSTYYEAFAQYAQGDNPLAARCKNFLRDINGWKERARFTPLCDFLWQLMMETGHYLMMGAMPRGSKRQMNLKLLVEEAKKFSDSNQADLYSFINYIKLLKKKEFDMPQSKEQREDSDFVKIMTIHKSKGLEFPMVIVSDMGSLLSHRSDGIPLDFHKNIGLGLRYVDVEEKWYRTTLPQRLIKRMIAQEEVEEEKRVLYVAMTRAKDFLYLVGTARSKNTLQEIADLNKVNNNCYINMIAPHLPFLFIDSGKIQIDEAELPDEERTIRPKEALFGEEIYEGELSQERKERIEEILNYRYPFESGRSIKSKYTVSELNIGDIEKEIRAGQNQRGCLVSDEELAEAEEKRNIFVNLRIPNFIAEEHILTAAEKGTVYHKIMEEIDFDLAAKEGLEYIENFAQQMVEQGVLLEEEKEAIDISKVHAFFKSDLGIRAAKACADGKLYKEKPFTLKKTVCGESILTQGIIDCYFEEDGDIILLDYKTNKVSENKNLDEELARIKETYRKQMEIYSEALSKAKNKEVKEAYLFLADVGTVVRY